MTRWSRTRRFINFILSGFCALRISRNKQEVEKSNATQQDRFRASKEVSVMAWIENQFGDVLLLKQVRGNRFWTLPGGKVRPREPIEEALRREVEEEIGLQNSAIALVPFLTVRKRR